MKRSPSSTTSSSSSSSSSSCAEPEILQVDQSEKPKAKRARKENGGKSQNSASGRRSSIYRGVTRFGIFSHFLAISQVGFRLHVWNSWLIVKFECRHRWTGRYEAHLWDKSSWNNVQNKKGRQGKIIKYLKKRAFWKLKKKKLINLKLVIIENQGDLLGWYCLFNLLGFFQIFNFF